MAIKSLTNFLGTTLELPSLLPSDSLQLVSALHTSLDSRQILELFFHGLQTRMKCDGLVYKHSNKQLLIELGQLAQHKLEYRLTTENDDLGEICFCRQIPFDDREILLFEELMCLLINPLRNAFKHLEAQEAALHDPLTGVFNRSALEPALRRDIDLAKRHNSEVSVLSLDLDLFKTVNDNYGHQAGDAVLQNFANKLQSSVRDSDLVFRIGGEEFIILLSNTDTTGAIKLADRICKAIANLITHYKQYAIKATVSIGIASLISGDTQQTLLEKADQALYRAKHEGRNRISI